MPKIRARAHGQTKTGEGRGVALAGQELVSAIARFLRCSDWGSGGGFPPPRVDAAESPAQGRSTTRVRPLPGSPAVFVTSILRRWIPRPASVSFGKS